MITGQRVFVRIRELDKSPVNASGTIVAFLPEWIAVLTDKGNFIYASPIAVTIDWTLMVEDANGVKRPLTDSDGNAL
jgi:hypothetical protein